jgi:predicted permease
MMEPATGWLSDVHLLVFLLSLSLGSALLIVAVMAWRVERLGLHRALQREGHHGIVNAAPRSMRAWTLSVQAAISLALLMGVGLLARSYAGLVSESVGFNSESSLALRVVLPEPRYPTGDARRAFYRESIVSLRSLPGVEHLGATSALPLDDVPRMAFGVTLRDRNTESAVWCSVTPDYFKALGVPLLKGRFFSDRDNERAAPVAIVNESLARRLWPEGWRDANLEDIGETIEYGAIVGVVGDTRDGGPQHEPSATLYLPHAQRPFPAMTLVVRFVGDKRPLLAGMRSALKAIDHDVTWNQAFSIGELVDRALAPQRLQMLAMSFLAGLGLILAALGISGVTVHEISRRKREVAVRRSLGANARAVILLVARKSIWPVLVGCVAGMALAVPFMRLFASRTHGIEAWDWTTAIIAPVTLLLVALLATWFPARRAALIDPMEALRCD